MSKLPLISPVVLAQANALALLRGIELHTLAVRTRDCVAASIQYLEGAADALQLYLYAPDSHRVAPIADGAAASNTSSGGTRSQAAPDPLPPCKFGFLTDQRPCSCLCQDCLVPERTEADLPIIVCVPSATPPLAWRRPPILSPCTARPHNSQQKGATS